VLEGALQGLGLAAILVLGYAALRSAGVAPALDRSSVFISLIVGVLLLTLANRDRSIPLWAALDARNPWLGRMAGAVLLVVIAAMLMPPLREILGLALPDGRAIATATLMSVTGLAWLETLRRVLPRFRGDGLLR